MNTGAAFPVVWFLVANFILIMILAEPKPSPRHPGKRLLRRLGVLALSVSAIAALVVTGVMAF